MDQDDKNQKQPRQPLIIPKRPIVRETPLRQHTSEQHVSDSSAHTANPATAILRSNIDEIYKNDPNAQMSTEQQTISDTQPPTQATNSERTAPESPQTEQPSAISDHTALVQPNQQQDTTSYDQPQANQSKQNLSVDPYDKTHSTHKLQADSDTWKEYHSAWQNYYQQYFYRHYAANLQQKDAELRAEREKQTSPVTDPSGMQGAISENDALHSLRSELRAKIRSSGQKVRKSRHFIPFAAGLSVMLLFVLLQYNTQVVGFFASFISPGNVIPENIIVDESIDVPVGPEPKLIIPKINVNEPIVYENTMGSTTEETNKRQLEAMKKGIAWFPIPGANASPGQLGNTVLSAHSTNNIFETGNHKFVFLHLPELKKGDTAYVNDKGTRYTYKVTKTEVVQPDEVNKLVYKTDIPVMTLITCVPIGTTEKRLLVTAEQISPSPTTAEPAPAKSENLEPTKMTGNSPTLLERIFGT